MTRELPHYRTQLGNTLLYIKRQNLQLFLLIRKNILLHTAEKIASLLRWLGWGLGFRVLFFHKFGYFCSLFSELIPRTASFKMTLDILLFRFNTSNFQISHWQGNDQVCGHQPRIIDLFTTQITVTRRPMGGASLYLEYFKPFTVTHNNNLRR